MPHSNREIVTDEVLLTRLQRTKADVKWINKDGETVGTISAAMAHGIAKAGRFEGKASPTRVYFIREIPTPTPERDDSYWAERASIRWHEDQRVSVPKHIRTKARGDMWDAMLHRSPQPKAWQRPVA